MEIIDAASRMNINAATKEMLLQLPGVDDALSDAILDWREPERPRVRREPRITTRRCPSPTCLEGPFETVGELLLVRDVTPALSMARPKRGHGEPPSDDRPLSEKVTVLSQERNVNAEEARVNLNEATVGAPADRRADARAGAGGGHRGYRQQRGTFSPSATCSRCPVSARMMCRRSRIT